MKTLGTGLFIFSALGVLALACSSDPEPNIQPTPQGSGSGGQATGGTSGGAAGSGGANMAGTGGSGGSGGGDCNPACDPGKLCVQGECICPLYAPEYCAAEGACVNFTDDPDHCGDCDTVCAAMSACSTGACTPEPTTIYTTTGCGRLNLQLSDGTLFWVNEMAGSVHSLDLTGSTAEELVSGLTAASSLVLDATNVYVVTGNSLSRIPIGGGAAETVVTEAAPIFDVAVSDGMLYYGFGENVKSVSADADDGTGTVVATAESGGLPKGVAVDGDFVIWAADSANNVEFDLISAEMRVKLGQSQGSLMFGPRSVAVDGTHVYWVNGSTIERAAYDPEPMGQTNVAASLDSQPITAFAVNATTAYYGVEGNVEKALIGEDSAWVARGQGGELEMGEGGILSMVVDDTNVYWSTKDCAIKKTGL